MIMKNNENIQIFIRGWWIIASALLIGIGAAYIYSYSQVDIFNTTATYLAASKIRSTDPRDLIESEDTLAGRATLVNTYCGILESQTIFNSAAISLGFQPELVKSFKTSCAVIPDSNILSVEVQGPSSQFVADLANAVGTVGIEYISGLQEVYELQRLDRAIQSTEPIAPNHIVDITMGVIISGLGGVALVWLQVTLNPPSNRQVKGDTKKRS